MLQIEGFHFLGILSISPYWETLFLFFRCNCWYSRSANAKLPENIRNSCFSRTQGQGCYLRCGERNHGGVHQTHRRSGWARVADGLRWVGGNLVATQTLLIRLCYYTKGSRMWAGLHAARVKNKRGKCVRRWIAVSPSSLCLSTWRIELYCS